MKARLKDASDIIISACTIAKNEEKTIAKSIESYKDYVDEIIIVDTGSTDNTVEIAQSLGAKVLQIQWNNDFAAAKNVAIDAASGEWIIFLDSDEFFFGDTCKNVRQVIQEAISFNKNAIGCRMENIDIDNGNKIAEIFTIRVFVAGTRYQYPVHEEIYNPNGMNVLTVDKTYFFIGHTGYSSKLAHQKCERNLELMFSELEGNIDERRKITYYSYISDSYFGLSKYNEAIKYAQKFLEESEDKGIRIIGCEIKPYLNIISSLECQYAENDEIDKYIEMFEQKFPDCPDTVYARARSLLRHHQYRQALSKFSEALKMSENYSGIYINSVDTDKSSVFNNCGVCEESIFNIPSAMDWYYKGSCEHDNYERPLSNLMRVVKDMPEDEVSKFTNSLYSGADDKKRISIMSALMTNYMTEQLVNCYASYRANNDQDALYSDVTAFIMAGRGNYTVATQMFAINYQVNFNIEISMRCLFFAALSENEDCIQQALKIADPAHAFALGFIEQPKLELEKDDIKSIARIITECERFGKIDFAVQKIEKLAEKLDGNQMHILALKLADNYAFKAALSAAQLSNKSPETVFLQGYLLYRLRRFSEASDLFHLAKHMGYADPALAALSETINDVSVSVRARSSRLSETERAELIRIIENEINEHSFEKAAQNILKYKQSAQPDAEIFTAEATLHFYRGDFKRAADAVEAGLLINSNSFDLLYDGGCIYEKMGNIGRAVNMYKRALENCSDKSVADSINQSLKLYISE